MSSLLSLFDNKIERYPGDNWHKLQKKRAHMESNPLILLPKLLSVFVLKTKKPLKMCNCIQQYHNEDNAQ